MNQENPPSLPPSVGFKDRKTGLTVFGILTVLLGVLSALSTLMMFAAPRQESQGHRGIIMVVAIYGGLALTFIWLGIGSIMARRWARALLLILSWATLVIGLISAVGVAAMSGQIVAAMRAAQPAGQPALPEAAQWTIIVVMIAVMAVILVILPAIWAYFYGSKNVKATCEACDPVERWTDRCPLPVLAASLMLVFGAVSMIVTAISMHGVIPFFGVYLSGLPGAFVYIILGTLWFFAGWAMYRLDPRGWWVALLILCFHPISSAITFSHHGIMEFYKLAGYSEAEMTRIQQMGLFGGNNMIWFTLASVLPWLIYLLFIRKYFRRAA